MTHRAAALRVTRPGATYQCQFGFLSLALQTVCHRHTFRTSMCPFYSLLRPPVRWGREWQQPLPATIQGLLKDSYLLLLPSPPPPQGLLPITYKMEKNRLLSRASRSLSSPTVNFSSSHVLCEFTLTHWTLPKHMLLFQASKPFHFFLLLRRAFYSSVSQEIPTCTLKFCQMPLPETVQPSILSILCAFRTFCTWFLPPITQHGVICF